MPELDRTTVGLRIFGDDLNPDEITRLMGVEPTDYARKGDTRRTRTGREVVARSGSWRLDAGVPGDLGTRIAALLATLPSDPSLLRELTRRYRCDVFCGLFMRDANEGTTLLPEVMAMLGERGLPLGLDIYSTSD